ncbi:MAG: hypothetical protein OXH46_07965 [Gemmatimonadetes bacterium]|nr:hypothetical protein [Gemmatimonadota bacterium]
MLSVLQRQLAGRNAQVLGEEAPQRDAGATEPGARLRADESFGAGALVRAQEGAVAGPATGGEVDSPQVKAGAR